MNSFDKYAKRLGMSERVTTDKRLEASKNKFERNFNTSPSYYNTDIDGEFVDTIINKTNNYSVKLIHFKSNYSPRIGSLVDYNDKYHIILEIDNDEIFTFGKMEECNYFIDVQLGEKEKVLIGYEDNGRPVYDYQTRYKREPCIVKEKYYTSDENAQLPVPEGKLEVILQYQDIPNLTVNSEATLYDKTYKIVDISHINVVDEVGFLKIFAERRENEHERD